MNWKTSSHKLMGLLHELSTSKVPSYGHTLLQFVVTNGFSDYRNPQS